MRCPKCGFISFDHVEVCLKCNKDISKTSAQVVGTTYNATPPSFLRFDKGSDGRSGGSRRNSSFDKPRSEFDVVDPDLDVLVEDGENDELDSEIEFSGDFGGIDEIADDDSFEISMENGTDGDEDGIDLGQFEDAFDQQEPSIPDDEIQLELPDELSDISDLRPPQDDILGQPINQDESDAPAADVMDDAFDDFNFNLELDGMDDDFSLSSPDEKASENKDDVDFGDLSLDDIGLSDLDEETEPKKKKKSGKDNTDMDADLNFDLDLGGLSLDD